MDGPPAGAPRRRLPAEIWVKVVSRLHRPAPRPTGKAHRSEIRQDDLACMMRVSKMFNNITGVLLYSTIITDHLPSLIRNIRSPPAAQGLPSKRDLLCHAKHIFLEYADKSEPNYITLMRHGGVYFGLVAPGQEDTIRFCGAEADWIQQSARQLEGVFANCQTLSTGAFLPTQKDIWWMVWRLPDTHPYNLKSQLGIRVVNARLAIADRFVNRHIRTAAICQRAEYGPLTMLNTVWTFHEQTFCAHADSELGNCPAVIGEPGTSTRWYLTMNDAEDLTEAITTIPRTVNGHHSHREDLRKGLFPGAVELLDKNPFSVDIYMSSRFGTTFGVEEMREWISGAIEHQKKLAVERHGIDPVRAKRDEWRVNVISEDTPPCPGCGWRVEDNEAVRNVICRT